MNERKVQIWLRPDQVDLLRSVLITTNTELGDGRLNNALERSMLQFCKRRIDELLTLIPKPVRDGDGP